MKAMEMLGRDHHAPHDAVVWIDDHRAVIIEARRGGRDHVAVLDRMATESRAAFDTRTIDEVINLERLVVSGPSDARTAFERTYVAITHRPDRLLDVELASGAGDLPLSA